jgi:ketosteroid isomerase-like protein
MNTDEHGDDEARIRALLERWATAVHAGDMEGVLADHADDNCSITTPEAVARTGYPA